MTVSITNSHLAKRFVTQSRKLLKARHEDARKTIIPMGSTISGQQKQQHRFHHPDPFNPKTTMGWNAALKEAEIPLTKFNQETEEGLRLGLPGASSIDDKTIPTFSRGELPHFAGINTFLKAPYIEDAKAVGAYDCAVVGVPFDGGCTVRLKLCNLCEAASLCFSFEFSKFYFI